MLKSDDSSIITQARVTKVTERYAQLEIDGIKGDRRVDRSKWPIFAATQVGYCYCLEVKLEGECMPTGELEILAIEELTLNGKQNSTPDEIWAALQKYSQRYSHIKPAEH